MSHRVIVQPSPASTQPTRYSPEMLRHIGTQVEALMSQHSGLKLHKRAIERQLAAIAAQLEQIASIAHEQGYWKPQGRVQNYHRQDVYQLGESTQRLFDDFAQLDQRVEQVHARLADIKQRRQLAAETTPQRVFDALATVADRISVQGEIDMIVDLLQAAPQPRWFRWLFVHRKGTKRYV